MEEIAKDVLSYSHQEMGTPLLLNVRMLMVLFLWELWIGVANGLGNIF